MTTQSLIGRARDAVRRRGDDEAPITRLIAELCDELEHLQNAHGKRLSWNASLPEFVRRDVVREIIAAGDEAARELCEARAEVERLKAIMNSSDDWASQRIQSLELQVAIPSVTASVAAENGARRERAAVVAWTKAAVAAWEGDDEIAAVDAVQDLLADFEAGAHRSDVREGSDG